VDHVFEKRSSSGDVVKLDGLGEVKGTALQLVLLASAHGFRGHWQGPVWDIGRDQSGRFHGSEMYPLHRDKALAAIKTLVDGGAHKLVEWPPTAVANGPRPIVYFIRDELMYVAPDVIAVFDAFYSPGAWAELLRSDPPSKKIILEDAIDGGQGLSKQLIAAEMTEHRFQPDNATLLQLLVIRSIDADHRHPDGSQKVLTLMKALVEGGVRSCPRLQRRAAR